MSSEATGLLGCNRTAGQLERASSPGTELPLKVRALLTPALYLLVCRPNSRVGLFGRAAPIARYTSGKAKYLLETDSAQVVRTKDEKDFGKRVKQVRETVK